MPKIEETDKPKKMVLKQTKERNDIMVKTLSRIDDFKEIRRQTYDLLRNRTLVDYWDDSVKRLSQYKLRPAHKEQWQANTASNKPADKLIGILSKLAGQPMEVQVHAVDDVSEQAKKKERVLQAALKAAGRKNNDNFQLVLEMYGAMAKGTVVGFESWRFGKQDQRVITNIDDKTGEVKFKKKTVNKWNDVWGEIVPVENFYPGNIYIRPGQIQDMADCAMRKIFKWDKWETDFGEYIDADEVQPRNQTNAGDEDQLFYKFEDDVDEDEVEQWYYFNQETDEMIIIANGIWINPIGKAVVSPLPWNHKKLPFWAAVFEPHAEDYFYGRSLADKLISMIDMQDALFDRILDQLALSVHKPIVTRKNAISLTKGFRKQGDVIQIKGGGPINQEFATIDVQEPSQAHIQMLNIIEGRLEQTAITSGTASTGERKTATQVLQEREAAVELVSLFLKLMEFAIRDKNILRLSNIVQFYTLPVHKKSKLAKFRKIILRDERLTDGKLGTLDLEFTDRNIPQVQQEIEQTANQSLEPIEIIRLSPSFIRDVEMELEIIPATSVKQTDSVRQAFELNFQQVITELYPDKYNRDTGFEDLLRKFNKNPRRLTASTPEQVADMGPNVEQGVGGPASNIPEGLSSSLRSIAQ